MANHTRTGFFRMNEIATREEVLEMLTEQARNGSITAAAALERALRLGGGQQDDVEEAIDRILAADDD
jgi:hypothetical protein